MYAIIILTDEYHSAICGYLFVLVKFGDGN